MKNLENYGVQELDAREVKSINGGIFFYQGRCKVSAKRVVKRPVMIGE